MRKQSKRGFTLVELVIVIAVIAILAGVMIATFSNVVNKANKSREEQEMKQAELEQKSEDILKKLENADWLSWEDIEVAIAEGLKDVNAGASSAEVSEAVEKAIQKYADSLGSGNTGVTEAQIQYIIENSLKGQLTAAQVEAIIKKNTNSVVTLSSSQINQIKEAASANSLTAAQVQQIVQAVANSSTTTVTDAVNTALAGATASLSTLTEEQITAIVSGTMEKYVRNGVAGDYSWYTQEIADKIAAGTAQEFVIGGENATMTVEQFKAIAGLSAEGVTFKGVTITIAEDIDLSGSTWTPLGTDKAFEGSIVGAGDTPVQIKGVVIDTTFNSIKQGYAISVDKKTGNADKYGVGFVAALGTGAKLSNLEITVNYDISDTGADGVLVGGAVGYLCGGTVENVTVYGSVKNNYRVGGVVGGGFGTITNCHNYADVTSTARELKSAYHYAAGIVGYARDFSVAQAAGSEKQALTITDCSNHGTITSNDTKAGNWTFEFVGQISSNTVTVTLDGETLTGNSGK